MQQKDGHAIETVSRLKNKVQIPKFNCPELCCV